MNPVRFEPSFINILYRSFEVSQSQVLSTLSHTPSETLKEFTESIIPFLEPISVLQNRTGLIMIPYTDTAQNTQFYIGEALIAEARVSIIGGSEGYGACLGYDLEQALAIALLDAALSGNIQTETILTFVHEQAALQAEADTALLRAVESTRAEMETF
jgi:alpha-D-ribose 1-methylphosphonate 5-triphosphate synthase subunit PhnG